MWLVDLLDRCKQLTDWTADLQQPKVAWISGFFNPQSFLTAVMQTTARKSDWPLDKTVTQTEVTKKNMEDITALPRDGAYVGGLSMEGARWDEKSMNIDDSRAKELFAAMPVIWIKAVTVDKAEQKDTYQCPVYKTQSRGQTFVFTAGLKTKDPVNKWILAGVGLLMDIMS